MERLEAATALLERTLSWLEERQSVPARLRRFQPPSSRAAREAELHEKLAAVERELAELKAAAARCETC